MAKVNAYKIYVEMYDEAKRDKVQGLPQKWSHSDFVCELVADMMRMTDGTNKKRSASKMEGLEMSLNRSSLASSGGGGQSSGGGDNDESEEDDFFCESGVAAVLKKYRLRISL